MKSTWALTATTAALASLLIAAPAQSQISYPTQPIKLLVPFPAGSGTDVVARLISRDLSQTLGQPVIVENQAGGGGLIATQSTARAAPDGHTLFLTTSAHAILPSLQSKLQFDVVDDFEAVSLVCAGPLVLTAHPSFPAKSISELISLAKSKPGQINYASSGTGTAPHLAVELLKSMTGIDIVHIPYRGGSPAMNDVVAGVVPLYFAAPSTAIPHVQSGAVRALGISTDKRPDFIKDIPTIAEQGVPGYNTELWYGLLAPRNTPPEIVQKLNTEIAKILQKPEVRNVLLGLGFEPKNLTPAEFRDYIRAEVKRWAAVATAANLAKQ